MSLDFLKKSGERLLAAEYNGLQILTRLARHPGDQPWGVVQLRPDVENLAIDVLCSRGRFIEGLSVSAEQLDTAGAELILNVPAAGAKHLQLMIAATAPELSKHPWGRLDFAAVALQPVLFLHPWLVKRFGVRQEELKQLGLWTGLPQGLRYDVQSLTCAVQQGASVLSCAWVRRLWESLCMALSPASAPPAFNSSGDCATLVALEAHLADVIWCRGLAAHAAEVFSKFADCYTAHPRLALMPFRTHSQRHYQVTRVA